MVTRLFLYSLFSAIDMKGTAPLMFFLVVFFISLVNCVVIKNEEPLTKPPPQVETLPWLSFLQHQENTKRKAIENFEKQHLGETFQLCPSGVTGHYPYPPDCKRFINCWKGRGAIQTCAPGTLFNPETSECDFPGKVKCLEGEEGFGDQIPMPSRERYVRFPHQRPQIASNPRFARNQVDNQSKPDSVLTQPYPVRPPYFGPSHLKPPTRPTNGLSQGKDIRPHCPVGVTGLFVHPTDCKKFLKCWNGNTIIQNCGPGTFFNPLSSVCDHPRNVPCTHEENYIPGDSGLIQEEIQVPEETIHYEKLKNINQDISSSATKGGKKSTRPNYNKQTSQTSSSSGFESEIDDLQRPSNVKENTTHRKPKIINTGNNQLPSQVLNSNEKEPVTILTPPAYNSAQFDGYGNLIGSNNYKSISGVLPEENNQNGFISTKEPQQQIFRQPGQHTHLHHSYWSASNSLNSQTEVQSPDTKYPVYNYPIQGSNSMHRQKGQDKTRDYYGMILSKPNEQHQFFFPYYSNHMYYPLYQHHQPVYPSMYLQPPVQQSFPYYAPSHAFSQKVGNVPYKIPAGGFNAPLPNRTPYYHHPTLLTETNPCLFGSVKKNFNEPNAPLCEPSVPFYQPNKNINASGSSNILQSSTSLCTKSNGGSKENPSVPECEPNISYYQPVVIDVTPKPSKVQPSVISPPKTPGYYPEFSVPNHHPKLPTFVSGTYPQQFEGLPKEQQPGYSKPEPNWNVSFYNEEQLVSSYSGQQPGPLYLPQFPESSSTQKQSGNSNLSKQKPGISPIPSQPETSRLPLHPVALYPIQQPESSYSQQLTFSQNKPPSQSQNGNPLSQPTTPTSDSSQTSFNNDSQVNYYPQYPTGYFPQYQPVYPNSNCQSQGYPTISKSDPAFSTQPPLGQGQIPINDLFSPVNKPTGGQELITQKLTHPAQDPFSPVYENSDSYVSSKQRPPQETEGHFINTQTDYSNNPYSSPKNNNNYIDLSLDQNHSLYSDRPDYSYPVNNNEIVQGHPSQDTARYPVKSSNIISTEFIPKESATFPPYPGNTYDSETSTIKSIKDTRPSGVKSKVEPPKQYVLDKIDLRTKPESEKNENTQPSEEVEKLDDDFVRGTKRPSHSHPDKYSQSEDGVHNIKLNTNSDEENEFVTTTKPLEINDKPKNINKKPYVKVKQTPPNGQMLRLRNGASHLDGYLEMKDSSSKWGLVCDESGGWDINEATVACRELGFIRGAELSWQGYPIKSDVEQLFVAVNSINCTGKEASLLECKITRSPKKQCDIGRNAVGLRCYDNLASHCQPGEILYNQYCYKLHGKENPDDPGIKTDEASEKCKLFGGKLVDITSQYENDFISEWLVKKHPEVTSVVTGGIGISVLGRPMWLWEGTNDPMVYERWWSGWSGDQKIPKGSIDGPLCIVLKKTFACSDSNDDNQRNIEVEQEKDDTCSADYFFWDVEDCNKLRTSVFVCERPMDDIGCVVGSGEGYIGTANTTASGVPCLPWDHPKVVEGLARRGVAQERSGHLFGHNYCRNLGNPDRHPWCFVEGKGNSEYCAIPQCWDSVSGYSRSSGSAPSCHQDYFECKPGECIKNEWVCDGQKDCQNGLDEEKCMAFIREFKKFPNKKISLRGNERWPETNENTCAKLCMQTKNFKCRSFSYNRKHNDCILSDSNIGLSGKIVPAEGWIYYERSSESLPCTLEKGFFGCQNGKCINVTNVCDGKNNCEDGSDEKDCRRLGYEIRLAGSSLIHEGRVEVKILGKWGVICDDMFDIRDADVVCRELGFKLGAADAYKHSRFPLDNPLFLINNLECWGNETSIRECSFPGWGKHNCGPDEIAGVACRVAGQECPIDQWQCKTSQECIPIVYLCDGLEECYDKSDEDNKMCSSPIQIRLSGGPNSTAGRLEIKYLGTWGTVCDDDFGTEAANAVCRMLGYNGLSIVKKNAYFGPGKGPIWLDRGQCFDHETDFEECKKYLGKENNCNHDEDVSLICSQQDINQKSSAVKPLISSSIENNTLTTEEKVRQVLILECSDKPKNKFGLQNQFERVVGGTDIVGGTLPWQASIRVKSGGRKSVHWCGAIIISPYHVLTASHCLRDYQKAAYYIRVGDYDTEVLDPHEKEFEIEHLYMHPEFSKNINLNNDIGLVKIKGEIIFGDSVKPACLAPSRDIYRPGTNCSVSGWGSVSAKSVGFARTLRRAYVPILEPSVCRASFVYGESLSDGMFCAGQLNGEVDSCQGDSGGPLMCQYEDREYLFGITSWGHGCGRANKPGVYTNVAHYTEWIQDKIQTSLK